MSSGRTSRLVAPSAGKRRVSSNETPSRVNANKSGSRIGSGKNDVIRDGVRSTTVTSSSRDSAGSCDGLSSGTDDYVTVQFSRRLPSTRSTSNDDVVRRVPCAGVTSLPRDQQVVLAAHIKLYTSWVNHYLQKSSSGGRLVSDLQHDLGDFTILSRLLYAVVDERSSQSSKPTRQQLTSVEDCFTFLSQLGIRLDNIKPQDIRAGNLAAVFILLYNLSHYKKPSLSTVTTSTVTTPVSTERTSNPGSVVSRGRRQLPSTLDNMPSRLPSPMMTSSQQRAARADDNVKIPQVLVSHGGEPVDNVTSRLHGNSNNNNNSLPRDKVAASRGNQLPVPGRTARSSSLKPPTDVTSQATSSGKRSKPQSADHRPRTSGLPAPSSTRQTSKIPGVMRGADAGMTSPSERPGSASLPLSKSRVSSATAAAAKTGSSTTSKAPRVPTRSLSRPSGMAKPGRRTTEPPSTSSVSRDVEEDSSRATSVSGSTTSVSTVLTQDGDGHGTTSRDPGQPGMIHRTPSRLTAPRAGSASKLVKPQMTATSTVVQSNGEGTPGPGSRISKPRSQSAVGCGGDVAMTSQNHHSVTKSSVATVRQLSVDANSMDKMAAVGREPEAVMTSHAATRLNSLNSPNTTADDDVVTGNDVIDVDTAFSVAPMAPMSSRAYMTSSGNPIMTSRLLSASQRPFTPLTGRYVLATGSGYVSDGDVAIPVGGGYAGLRHSGYVSEGGASLYSRRRHQVAHFDLDNVSDDSDDYSSVNSADIDKALSDDDDEEPADDVTTDHDLPPEVSETGSSRHVGFADASESVSGTDLRALDASYAVRQSCFDRGSAERRTLPTFTTNDLISGVPFRRRRDVVMTSSSNPAHDLHVRPRSRSVGRTAKKEVTSPSTGAGVGAPVAASTPKSLKLSAVGTPRSSRTPCDSDAARGERLSNYGVGTLLPARRLSGSLTPSGTVPVLEHGRRSIDAGGGHQTAAVTDTASLFASYQLRRPLSGTASTSATTSDTECYAVGRRSLTRSGYGAWSHGVAKPPSTSFYHVDQLTSHHPASVGTVVSQGHWNSGGSSGRHTITAVTSADSMLHGSSLSLGSNSSSVYSNAEEMHAHEVSKLRRELEAAQAKIVSLSSHLNTNAHVVFAFEQSLVNMTQRLQRLAATTDQKDAELNELRAMIDTMRQQSGMSTEPSSDADRSTTMTKSLRRHMSSDSVISALSATSQQSFVSAADVDKKKKKNKNWLSSFGKAFTRKKKADSMSDAESEVSSLYADASLSVTGNTSSQNLTVSSTPIRNSRSDAVLPSDTATSEAAVLALQEQLHEKELRLTDVQLEALSSAHQLQQLQDTINKMKTEMLSLRVDNDRLNKLVKVQTTSSSSTGDGPSAELPTAKETRTHLSGVTSDVVDMSDESTSLSLARNRLDVLLKDRSSHSNSCQPITLSIRQSSSNDATETMIATLNLDSKMSWNFLCDVATKHFKDYLLKLDSNTSLGLSEDSIRNFSIGDLEFGRGLENPELLPCGYLVGSNTNVSITLKGAEERSVDSLAFDTLVPKSIVHRYVSLLMEHRRIILCGSSGTGKSYLAQKFAEHVLIRSGIMVEAGSIATFTVDSKTSRELRPYLSSVTEKCEQNAADLPKVIIIDGLHHILSPLSDAFNGFLSVDYKSSPYIIGVMNQNTSGSTTDLQLHHNFRWVLCANHMEPVQGFLGRYLRRRLLDVQVTGGVTAADMEEIVEWLPRVWQQVNRVLETHGGSDVTIGPRLFMSCPMVTKEVARWFTDLWNHSIVPYILNAVREPTQMHGKRSGWEDPLEWVISTCPWKDSCNFDSSALQKIRPEDVGCETASMSTSSVVNDMNVANLSSKRSSSVEPADPLLTMLLKIKETTSSAGGAELPSPSANDRRHIGVTATS